MSSQGKSAALISTYPATKIVVECDVCGMRAKFDKLEMLEAGGDRELGRLLDEIARRKGCTRLDKFDIHNLCGAKYANILPGNAYAKMRDGR